LIDQAAAKKNKKIFIEQRRADIRPDPRPASAAQAAQASGLAFHSIYLVY
jgi:hypothetical protein